MAHARSVSPQLGVSSSLLRYLTLPLGDRHPEVLRRHLALAADLLFLRGRITQVTCYSAMQ